MKTINIDEVEKIDVEMEGAKHVLKQLPLSSKDGSPNFSFRVFTIEPDGHTPYHVHESEHLNFVISGRGALVDGDGKEHVLERGDFAMVLPHERHQYRNKDTDEDFVMICAVPKEYE